jgi:anthranilate phosphoribosyltransferase
VKFADLIDPILARRDLDFDQAHRLMEYIIGGQATEAQIGGALVGLRVKGCTTQELAGFTTALRSAARQVSHSFDKLVDTCGTGGGAPTFNLSTGAALVAAAAGARVAKHGNRAVTSKCGSADVLEALGVRIGGDGESLLQQLETVGIVFLFAPSHHPAWRNVGNARRELGLRTVFNQLGPLVNPANASRQLIGVYDPGLMRSMAETLRYLSADRALLVHGLDGLDEISPCSESEVVRLADGEVQTMRLRPEDFGQSPLPPEAIRQAETVEENAEILREAISDVNSLRAQALIPNAAAAIWLAELAPDFLSAADMARNAIASGNAVGKLKQLIEVTE